MIDEKPSRRQLLQRRMPSREQIKAIIGPRAARDPWLDDEYDWDISDDYKHRSEASAGKSI